MTGETKTKSTRHAAKLSQWLCWTTDESEDNGSETIDAYTARDASERFAREYLAETGEFMDGAEVRVFVRPDAGGTVRVFDVDVEVEIIAFSHELTGDALRDVIAEAGVRNLAEKVTHVER